MQQPIAKDIHATAAFRHKAFQIIRRFFDERAYIEIDAPVLIPANAVEAYIDPIEACVHDPISDQITKKYLSTSPEIHMKRLLAHGLDRLYFLGHVFRDREGSPSHRNEFMMLEWYQTGAELNDLISECENLFALLSQQIGSSAPCLMSGIERLEMASAWDQYAGIDLEKALKRMQNGDQQALVKAVKISGESLRESADFEDAFAHIMTKRIEPQIGKNRPCALINWPAQTAALARLCPENPLFAQRFEIYFAGLELANAFNELTDPTEQRSRFNEANLVRAAHNRSVLPIDECFLSDLPGMRATSGIALGIDRLLMALCRATDLKEILCLAK